MQLPNLDEQAAAFGSDALELSQPLHFPVA